MTGKDKKYLCIYLVTQSINLHNLQKENGSIFKYHPLLWNENFKVLVVNLENIMLLMSAQF